MSDFSQNYITIRKFSKVILKFNFLCLKFQQKKNNFFVRKFNSNAFNLLSLYICMLARDRYVTFLNCNFFFFFKTFTFSNYQVVYFIIFVNRPAL